MGSSKHHCGIVSFWNKPGNDWLYWTKGLHTISYEYKNGTYRVYNLYNDDIKQRRYCKSDFVKILKKHKFIIGYTF